MHSSVAAPLRIVALAVLAVLMFFGLTASSAAASSKPLDERRLRLRSGRSSMIEFARQLAG